MKTYLFLLGCAFPLLLVAACTDAAKCTRGEVGCKCTVDQKCAGDALCIDESCIAPSKPNRDASTTPPRDAMPGIDSGEPQKPIDCTVSSFDDACEQFCRALCRSETDLCVASNCEPGYCDNGGGALHDSCVETCPNDVACLQDLCSKETVRECEDFGFRDKSDIYLSGCFNNDPKCVLSPDVGCSDTCGTHNGVGSDLVGNGQCEDGGEGSISPKACPRGTDCTDCRPRVCGKQLSKCDSAADCCGFFDDGALCVDIDRDTTIKDPRCLVTCVGDKGCDDGYTCTGIKDNTVFVCSP